MTARTPSRSPRAYSIEEQNQRRVDYLRAEAAMHRAHAAWLESMPEPNDPNMLERHRHAIGFSLRWADNKELAADAIERGVSFSQAVPA